MLSDEALIPIIDSISQITEFDYSNNSIRFDFTVPVFPAKGKVEFRYFLDGFDNDSSQWTPLSYKEYTNLPDEDYIFTVESRNEYGQILQKSSFAFKISTPIFRRWWAFLIYALILLLLGRIILRWRVKKTEKEKAELEQIVKDRTAEIEKSKLEIEKQRDIAYHQRKEILDSINYAKRIQKAVLPSRNYVDKILNEYFILFKPRDIVSGDFFWIKKIENFTAVIAADCTGHGVPGAFMSMLGYSFLNEIVTKGRILNTSEMMNSLREKIKDSMHVEGQDAGQKDGMDVAFYVVDNEKLELKFSGAYNPLFIVRKTSLIEDVSTIETSNIKVITEQENPEYSIIELKADRQPIGTHIKEISFSEMKIKLLKGDSLYTFSDGYIDQFGGEVGSKFKIKRFKDLLLGIQEKSMFDQKYVLEQTLIKWQGDLNQIDDVMVIGLRV